MGEATKALLVVEDNPADIYLIRKAVEECGPDIHLSVIPNGRDALAFLRQEGAFALEPSPALILLDLRGRIAPRGAARAQDPRSAARRVPLSGGAAQSPVAGGRQRGV